jgi:hypothetical protein
MELILRVSSGPEPGVERIGGEGLTHYVPTR